MLTSRGEANKSFSSGWAEEGCNLSQDGIIDLCSRLYDTVIMKEVTALPTLPTRNSDAHKGDLGRVLVVAGSRGMAGAAVLCAQGALRAGAGLVHLALPEEVYPIAAPQSPCVIHHPLPQTDSGTISKEAIGKIEALAGEYDVTALGPGLTTEAETKAVVLSLVSNVEKTMVIDADGLNAVGADHASLFKSKGPRILTPHPGEMAGLTGISTKDVQKDRMKTAVDFASQYGVCLVLKGMNTVVTDGNFVYVNKSGNSGMATAGAGDVLTGMTAGLRAQGMNDFESAQLAVYLHGLAGDIAANKLGMHSVTALDILKFIPQAFIEFARKNSNG